MTDRTVLVVEDEFGMAEVLQLMLEVEGWRVVLAHNGRHAQERIAVALPDLVLCDYMMPVMNGARLGVALRASPATAALPIVMMSAADEAEVRREFAGYDAFLHKPYRMDELLVTLQRVLAERRAPAPGPSGGDGGPVLRVAEAVRALLWPRAGALRLRGG